MSIKDIKDGWLNYLLTNMLKSRKPTPELQEYIDQRFAPSVVAMRWKEELTRMLHESR